MEGGGGKLKHVWKTYVKNQYLETTFQYVCNVRISSTPYYQIQWCVLSFFMLFLPTFLTKAAVKIGLPISEAGNREKNNSHLWYNRECDAKYSWVITWSRLKCNLWKNCLWQGICYLLIQSWSKLHYYFLNNFIYFFKSKAGVSCFLSRWWQATSIWGSIQNNTLQVWRMREGS